MSRKLLLRTDQNPYHINGRSNNKDWFIPDLNVCFNIFLEVIKKTQEMYSFEFHHFLLMDNHFHMIITTPQSNIDLGMRYFMTECSRKIARASNRINKIFGRRYHWTFISDSTQYAHTVKYLYRNPLEACMTSSSEKYIYSSINSSYKLFSENKQGFDEHLPKNKLEFIDWINEEYPEEVKLSIKKALEKKVFKISRSRINNQKVDLKKYLKNSKL
jgi:putative transposase